MKDLSAHRAVGPFGQRQQIQVLLRGLKDDFDICPSKIIGQEIFGRSVYVGDKNKITVLYCIPVLVLNFKLSVLIFMINKIIAESFKGVVLININICIYRFFKQFDPFFDTEICVMLIVYNLHLPTIMGFMSW